MFHGKPQVIYHIKTLECLCYATKLDFHDKFTSKSIHAVLWGTHPHRRAKQSMILKPTSFQLVGMLSSKKKFSFISIPKTSFLLVLILLLNVLLLIFFLSMMCNHLFHHLLVLIIIFYQMILPSLQIRHLILLLPVLLHLLPHILHLQLILLPLHHHLILLIHLPYHTNHSHKLYIPGSPLEYLDLLFGQLTMFTLLCLPILLHLILFSNLYLILIFPATFSPSLLTFHQTLSLPPILKPSKMTGWFKQ